MTHIDNPIFSVATYRTILATSLDGFWVITPEGRILDCNAEACRMLGYSREEMLTLSVWDVDAFETPEQVAIRMREITEKNGHRFFAVHRRKDTTLIEVEVSVHFSNEDGGFYVVFVRDISRQRQLESALRTERDLTRRYLGVASVIFVVLNPQQEIVLINRYGSEILGYRQEELVGRNWFDAVIPADEAPRVKKVFASLMGQEIEPVPYYENHILTKAGGRRLIAWDNNLVQSGDGAIDRVISCGRDITAQREIEVRLAEEHNKLEAVMTALDAGITFQDRDYRILYQNKKHQEMQGLHLGEFCFAAYQKRQEICPGCLLRQTFVDGKVHQREVSAPTKNGDIVYLEVTACPVFDVQGAIMGGIEAVRDISERKKLEHEVQRARNLESLGVFAGGLAHDFNNLLAAILGNLSLVQEVCRVETGATPLLGAMERACRRAQHLTQQLLTFAKGGAPVLDATRITDIVRHATSFFLTGSKVKLEITMAEDMWEVEVDGGQISQVIQNLAQNAEQAMPDGGRLRVTAANVEIGARLEALPLTPGRYVKLVFADTGCGILPENRARIFDPYFTTKETGSGLGLAISFSIIKKNRGHITVESVPGQGATFSLWLPAIKKGAPEAVTPSALPATTAGVGQGRILVMDDDQSIRDLSIAMLSALGHTVLAVADGEAMLAEYQAAQDRGQSYDLVILDLTIQGGMGGKEAMARLLALDPRAKAIVSSGYSDDPVVANCRQYGFQAVLNKPFTLRELRITLDRLLAPAAPLA